MGTVLSASVLHQMNSFTPFDNFQSRDKEVDSMALYNEPGLHSWKMVGPRYELVILFQRCTLTCTVTYLPSRRYQVLSYSYSSSMFHSW